MTPTEAGLIILAGVIVMAFGGYVIQDFENRKRQRRLLLMSWRDQIRRAEHLLMSMPGNFQSTELRKLLRLYIEKRLERINELENSDASRKALADFKEQASDLPDIPPHPAGSITLFDSYDSARRARALLREQSQFIKDLHASQELSAGAAKNLLKQVQQHFNHVTYDLELMDAQQTEQHQTIEVAIHKYRNCFMNLQKLNRHQQLDSQLYELRTYIEKLEHEIAEHEAIQAAERAAAEENEKKRKFPPNI